MSLRLILSVSFLALSLMACKTSKSKDDPQESFIVAITIPETAELRKAVYPVEACLPVDLTPLSMETSEPVALQRAVAVEFEIDSKEPENLQLDIYKDASCTEVTKAALLEKGGADIEKSKARVYVKSAAPGRAALGASVSGTTWSAGSFRNLEFEKK